ncbi:hypothetical protein [Promicromonospora sp. NPDC023805]|uniref:hypothetical protein n=1 Tax=Promicromonospora sp. NPDC023805 TaxID=3154696 RepID=UPI0033DF54A4
MLAFTVCFVVLLVVALQVPLIEREVSLRIASRYATVKDDRWVDVTSEQVRKLPPPPWDRHVAAEAVGATATIALPDRTNAAMTATIRRIVGLCMGLR